MPPSIREFASIEQLDELPRELGWPVEYRQIKPGSFNSTFADLEGDGWFLMEEKSSRSVEVVGGAPSGMFLMALSEGTPGAVNGKLLSSEYVYIQSPDSDFRATLSAGITVTQVGVASEIFEDLILCIAPDLSVPRQGVDLFATAPGRLEGARQAMRAAIFTPSTREALREEAVSTILTDIATAALDHGKAPSGRHLHRAAARKALSRAKDYIEAHLDETIRIPAICRYAGTSLRSLERIFARELGVSPQQYVKARRLNAVRRRLLAADGEPDIRVTTVAQHHGFEHLGRFSVEYRRYFGESPSETLLS